MEHLTQAVLALVRDMGLIGYWIAFLAALAETALLVGLLVPGSSFLLLMGVLAGQGALDIGDLLFFAILGAVLGDNVNYRLGRKYGKRWTEQGRWFLRGDYMRKAEGFFERHGGKSVFLGRFVPSGKELMPFIAGMAQMQRVPFFIWNLLGAIGWALQWIMPGYLFSQSLALAHAWLSRVGLGLVLVVALVLVVYVVRWMVVRYGASGFRFAASILRSVAVAVRDNPDVAAWALRHPRLVAFLKRRIDTSSVRGLPITLVGLAMLYVLLLFGGLVEDLLVKEAVVAADARLDSLVASFRTPLLNHLFYGITSLGNPGVVLCGMFLAAALMWRTRRARFIVPMLMSVVLAQSLTFVGKFAFHRARPDVGLIDQAGYSFPSGHATISVAFYGFLFFVLVHISRRWRTRVNLVFAAILMVLLIGFSRLYLGVHYLSDVLAGYLVGAQGLLFGVSLAYTGWSGVHLHFHRFAAGRSLPTWLTGLAIVAWLSVFTFGNLNAPLRGSVQTAVARTQVLGDPAQLLAAGDSRYAVSVAGVRKAPINLVFVATPVQLDSCLRSAGWKRAEPVDWGTVIGAYRDVVTGRGNPSAPLSPWFWADGPQTEQWSRPDSGDAVFDRYFLRIWKTPYRTADGLPLYVGSTGHESLPRWHIVPRPDAGFDAARAGLVKQLQSAAAVSVEPLVLPALKTVAGAGLEYEGGHSVISLSSCAG